ncbi:hypothetical protein [Hymenobacter psychrophilus]|uniref:DUF1735 domain-containing protein n=1 Tax=Hymenobacter psychrophilus TaxID=651662 RepID=A0A1H3H0P2_9BACT|nr:hypothetical protein [Hymenobacter psychrophilus]SDY09092.1 hypothetical protein SAMN04488069_105249 [Hymenobacter psychrophilus]
MKRLLTILFVFTAAFFTLASCEKEEPNFRAPTPQTQIIFDDNIDKATSDYKVGGDIALKIAADGATNVRIISRYNVDNGVALVPKFKTLDIVPVTGGVATVQIPVSSLRNTADGPIVGAGSAPASSRATNTYTLQVDAVLPDGSFVTRFFTAVIVRS